jgi:hypothetical protein
LSKALTGAERYEDAVKVADFLAETWPDRAEGLLRASEARAASHDWEATVDAATAVLARASEKGSVFHWWLRSDALRRLGKADEARELLAGATDAGVPEETVACIEVELLAGQGDAAAAREKWEKCDESEELDLKREAEGWLGLAEGNVELAVKRLAMAGANENLTRLAQAWLRLDEGKPEAALNLATKVIEDGTEPLWDSWLCKALALQALGKDAEATAVLAEGPLADGWVERHKSLSDKDVILTARGADWPAEVGRRAVTLQIQILAASDAEAAKALHDDAVAVYGDNEDLAAALVPPADEAPAEK